MIVAVIRHAKVDHKWKRRMTSAEYDKGCADYDAAAVLPVTVELPETSFQTIYVSGLPRTAATARQVFGEREMNVDTLINEVPERSGFDTGLKVPHFLHFPWNGTAWGEPACCQADLQEYCLCGSLCTTADVIVRAALLKDPKPGDLLVFRNTGAYSVTESNALFLSRNLPKVVMAKEGRSWMERENFGTYGLNH